MVTLILATALLPWLRLGHRAGIVRTNVHLCGVTDAGAVRTATAGLYQTPDAVIRRALFVSHRAGEGEEA